MRRIADCALVALAIAATAPPAAAQHDHHAQHTGDHGQTAAAAITGSAMVELELGQVDFLAESRDYQAIGIAGSARVAAFELSLHLPLYRIQLGSEWRESVGDPHIEGRWAALSRDWFEAGPSLAVMAPVGDDEIGLGMGHWMVMAGGFARAHAGRLSASASLVFGSTLGGSGGHAEHGGGVWPPVAAMNAREIGVATTGAFAVLDWLQVGARVAAGAPLGDGKSLGLAAVTAAVQWDRIGIGVELGHGVLDNPLGVRFSTHAAIGF